MTTACCDDLPHRRPRARRLTASAFFASLLLHACAIAGSALLLRTLPPSALPLGESIEVELVALSVPAAASRSSGSDAATPPADASASAPSASAQKDPKAPPRKHDRAIRHAQEHAFEARGDMDSEKGAQPAGAGQDIPGGERGHGREESGNGSLPLPFGAHVNPRPAYPEIARQRGQEGQLALLVSVDVHGNPTKVSIETSSGYSLLDQEAITTIRKWKFAPASRNGEAVPGSVRVPVTFRLR